jgi:hypothetical protein
MDMCPKLLLKSNQKLELNCYYFLAIGLELRTGIKWPQIYIKHENNMYKTGSYKIELTKSNQVKATAFFSVIFILITKLSGFTQSGFD